MRRKPNFFIVGAPKCGTTAMSEYLRSHPNIFMAEQKEPNFFSLDVEPSSKSFDEYMALFSAAADQEKVISEASTTYIFSDVALPQIKEFNPHAKLMMMLRKPSELAHSAHGHMLLRGVETETDFEKAWALQESRASGEKLPPGCPSFKLLQYKWIASLGSQLERLFKLFPREQIHITLMDDFSADPRREYLRVLSFLEIPDDGRTEFPRVNEAKSHKWLWLGQMSRQLRRRLHKPYLSLRRKINFQGTGLLSMINRFNTEKQSRAPLNPEFRSYLDELFNDEVELLEDLLERDLHNWRSDSQANSPRA